MSEQDTRKQLLNGICGSKSEKTPEIARQDGVLNISDVQEAYDRIAELTAERDQLSRDLTAEHALLLQFEDDNERLREAVNAFDLNQFYSLYRAKCEECERLKKVAHTQAESFKKLECELAGKQ